MLRACGGRVLQREGCWGLQVAVGAHLAVLMCIATMGGVCACVMVITFIATRGVCACLSSVPGVHRGDRPPAPTL